MKDPTYQPTDRTPVYCLTLYDWPERIDMVRFYPLIKAIARELGVETNDACISQSADYEGLKTLKPKTVERRIVREKLTGLLLVELSRLKHPVGTDYNYPSFFCSAEDCPRMFGLQPPVYQDSCFSLGFEQPKERFECGYLTSVVRRVCELVSPRFGEATVLEQRNQPSFHASGVGLGPGAADLVTEQRQLDWQAVFPYGDFRRQGKFRDIYPFNFISPAQMSNTITHKGQPVPLPEWIRLTGGGTLEQISDELWCWQVPAPALKKVRRTMMKQGLLIVTI